MTGAGVVSQADLAVFEAEFNSQPKNRLALNILTHTEQGEAALSRQGVVDATHTYSVKLADEGKPVTNQKASGRCWLFAATNVIRLRMRDKYNLQAFEFSQAFLFFWDKFERANFFLENILDTRTEDRDSRIVHHLLSTPQEDGGQYDMIVAIVEKHGLVPKDAYPETTASSGSRPLNWLLNAKLREFAVELREMHADGKQLEELRAHKQKCLAEAYRILVMHLGEPPKKFDWCFRAKPKPAKKDDADKQESEAAKQEDTKEKHFAFRDLTPLQFYQELVPFDMTNFVSLVHDPRNKFHELYTVDRLGNVQGGQPVRYVNLPIDQLKKYARKTLEKGQPVWFGCDVGKFFHRKAGVNSIESFDYELLMDVHYGMNKAQRLQHGESLMTHAMVLTGVDIKDDKTRKWRVENSWGEERGAKGYLCMTDRWFEEFLYQVVVAKNDLDQDILDVLKKTDNIHVLPAWDPMGALAQ